ncbi:type 1 glutamine amidotransferase [Vagococcus hydrophili]|uniref:Type 1 glutamine amidotransferase n=1 Tax=Vagococcus hydrophili TaxID=2714947 RepID=A0A6G8AUT1_9ENTE|nr:type 1 glutamine amidotransferase [Vagococcus hydrophili]QIL48747.1 type 1 glutamine amidotransferase [Vagococcus hydrophili]
MRINILQHTPNEGPGTIKEWAKCHNHDVFIYHPYQFGTLPSASETDMLVILGGPMSPNDNIDWIIEERKLISKLIEKNIPIFGACYGAQQIAKTLGCNISKASYKEVGWAPVYLKSDLIPDIPAKLTALHWHEETFELPKEAELLFSSDLLINQGFIISNKIIGLQFHFEPEQDDVREIAINDTDYAEQHNALKQSTSDILKAVVPKENKDVMFKLLDFITNEK